jgi:hypothetical protein
MKNKTTANWLILSMVLGVIGASVQDGADLFYALAGLGLMVFSIIGAIKVKKADETLAYITLGSVGLFWISYLANLEEGVTLTVYLIWIMAIWLSVKLYKLAD